MEEKQNINQLKKNGLFSTLSLFFQSGYSAALGLIANLILTILLSPKIFGIYITMLSIISLFNYFSDVGLAASLIQKKEVDDKDVSTVFTVQQILIVGLIIIGYFATPMIMKFYQLPKEGNYLYWALLLSFFLSSLKTIPSVFLERRIQFQKIVLVQIIENTVFYIAVSIFALLHQNLQSFTYAVILRSIVGLIIIYSLSFWKPAIGISVKHLKSLLSFGLPFQASSFLALFKDDLIILYLGKAIGFESLGYIGWAKKWAEAPIRIIMDNISRVLFPIIARIQHDKNKVSKLVDRILNYQTTILAPAILGLVLVMRAMVNIIPKYNKREAALPVFYLFCISSILSTYSTPFINLFNALGKVKLSLFFMVMWTIMAWIFTSVFTRLFGIYGFPITQVILSTTFFLVIWQAKKIIDFNFWQSVYKPIVSALFMGLIVFLMMIILSVNSIFSLILIIITAVTIYLLSLRIFFKINLITEIKILFS